MRKLFLSLLILLAGAGYAGAQSPGSPEALNGDEKAKAMRELQGKAHALLNEVIKDLASLHSAENRVHTLMVAAESLWKHDEKRARSLFNEAARALAEEIARPKVDDEEFHSRSQRFYDLRNHAIHPAERLDPALAMDFLNATRQVWHGTEEHRGGQERETALRLQVARRALEKDPQLSLKIAEESLESGIAFEITGLIMRLYRKDRQACEKLTDTVLRKLRDEDLSTNIVARRVAFSLLGAAVEGKRRAEQQPQNQTGAGVGIFGLSERATAELTEIVVRAAMSIVSRRGSFQEMPPYEMVIFSLLQPMMPEIEKYSPVEGKALLSKLEEYNKARESSTNAWQEYSGLQSSGSLDDYLKAIENAPQEVRTALYTQAATRAVNEGEIERARQIIYDKITNPSDRRELMLNIERQLLRQAAHEGKVEEARRLAANIPDREEQVTILADLARNASAKGDKKTALQLIDEAWSLMGGVAQSYSQMGAQLEIATAVASFDPGRGFEIIEQNIDKLNQIIAAASILEGFEIDEYFIEGEMRLWAGNALASTLKSYWDQLGALARADFNRARAAADRFERFEAQVMARLHVARGALSAPEANSTSGAVKPEPSSRIL